MKLLIILLAVWLGIASAAEPQRNLGIAPASTEKRVALVIGNAAYPGAGALKNPVNDANDIATKLKKLGFDVTVRTDMRYREMLRSLTDFGDKVQSGTEALFFYAGHGMQVRGKNYLLPIDAEIRNEASVSSEAVDVDQLLDKLSLARLSVVILDACRNNPFERRFRGSGQGLAQINAPTGTLIAYATAPGKVAADGDGRNGLYTAELLTAMDVPGIKIEDVFKRVRGNVVRKSNDAQTPWESSSLTGDFYFTFQGPTTVNVQQMPADPEAETWAAAQGANTVAGYQTYLDVYPNGRYAHAAKIRLTDLQKPAVSQPEKAPVVVAPTPAQVAVSSTPDDPEAAMWNEVKASGAREYLDAYLKQYPKGKYVALARVELKKLDERDKVQRAKEITEKQQAAERERQEALRSEQAAWDGAKATGSAAAYASYLVRFPKGRYAALAQAALPKLQREAAERKEREDALLKQQQAEAAQREEADMWRRAELATNSDTVQAYIDRYPFGQYVAQARIKLVTVKSIESEIPKSFKDCNECPTMIVIPAGSFSFGSQIKSVPQRPLPTVQIGNTFALARTEVTQKQWHDVMGNNPSNFQNCSECPVEKVSWNDVQTYLQRLSKLTGKQYRLPSEAEWEYACRAGASTEYCGSNSGDLVAWYKKNAGGETHPVTRKDKNRWGLHDMSGNVAEWTSDCSGRGYDIPIDGSPFLAGDCSSRKVRGGSWFKDEYYSSASSSESYSTTFRDEMIGFRPVRVMP